MKKLLSILILSLLVAAPFSADAQRVKRTKTEKQKQAQIEKKGDNRAQLEGELSQKQEHHLAIQDKNTRKRMKANQKKQRRIHKASLSLFIVGGFVKNEGVKPLTTNTLHLDV